MNVSLQQIDASILCLQYCFILAKVPPLGLFIENAEILASSNTSYACSILKLADFTDTAAQTRNDVHFIVGPRFGF